MPEQELGASYCCFRIGLDESDLVWMVAVQAVQVKFKEMLKETSVRLLSASLYPPYRGGTLIRNANSSGYVTFIE
jgi:hypothetical protein